ncbi:hypothetical protein PVK06_009924 [Gossypium arboreum]|uniref:Uncharacterized protein n=1 Tax=Gossypium arboreum TaxID=29729 RepID=A0ABR0QNW0_GOSAR|nr:hypothetical protein PVK06_009924 [Gossypium arboreum]
MCAKRVAVDARHRMLGRSGSILAQELLNGQQVVVVRCEEICMWGGSVRQKMNLMREEVKESRMSVLEVIIVGSKEN